jgi:hypothetical protein
VPLLVGAVSVRRGEMSVRIKAVVDKFVMELKEALDADIQDRIMKEREMQSYIAEREREVAEREAAWKAELSRREVPCPRPPSPPAQFSVPSIPHLVLASVFYCQLFRDHGTTSICFL